MGNIIEKIISWFSDSNRYKHFCLGAVYGLAASDLYCALYGGVGVSLALEFKDGQWGGKPDLVDAALTLGGVLTGFGLRTLVLCIILTQ